MMLNVFRLSFANVAHSSDDLGADRESQSDRQGQPRVFRYRRGHDEALLLLLVGSPRGYCMMREANVLYRSGKWL